MSLKRNIAANYLGQFYATAVGFAVVPVYMRYMGAEAYGLIGFFAMLQAWFNLLDLGLTPTIARESARYQGGAMSALEYRRVYRSLSVVFIAIALAGGAVLLAMAAPVTQQWLKLGSLQIEDVVDAVRIMAICVALRWLGGLYRGVVSGSERLVWLSGFNASIATLRFVAVLGSMAVWGYTPEVFFLHQLVVAALEVAVLFWMCHLLLPHRRNLTEPVGWSFQPVRPLLRFSLSIAFTSSVWVLATQTDKLILSGILPLSEYGYFTLAVLVAGGITIVTGPISMAIMPRMARLHAEGQHDEVRRLYNHAAQLVSVIAGSLAVTLVVCAEPLLFAWSGSREVTLSAAPILRLYAIGNGLLALGAFPYYLQYSRGDLRYHLIGNAVLVVVLVPAVVVAATQAGAIGAGWVWIATNTLYLFGWVAYVHARLAPGLHGPWLLGNVCWIVLPTTIVGWLISAAPFNEQDRTLALGHTLLVGLVSLAAAALAAPASRSVAVRHFRSCWQQADV